MIYISGQRKAVMNTQEYDLINKLIDTYVILELIKTKLQAMGITETSRLDRKETA